MNSSYSFCRHSLIWGWATWKRAWKKYREAEDQGLFELTHDFKTYSDIMSPVRLRAIKKTLSGKIDTWDYIWQMAMLMNEGLCIYPSINLVQNIGFGKGATHTKRKTFHSEIQANKMIFPLRHPDTIHIDKDFDERIARSYNPVNMLFDIIGRFISPRNTQN